MTALPTPLAPISVMAPSLHEPVQSSKQLPKAAPAVLRVISDGLAAIVEQLAGETNQMHPKQQYFVGGLAWLVHSFAYFSVEYEQLLSELARVSSSSPTNGSAFATPSSQAVTLTPLHQLESLTKPSPSGRGTLVYKDWSSVHIEEVEDEAAAYTPTDHEDDDNESVIELDTADGVRRPNRPSLSPPANIEARPTDTFLTFLLSYHSFGFTADDRLSPTNNRSLSLPDFFVPSFATASERKVYSIMHSWRNTEDIRVCIQRCFAEMSAFEMRLHLEAEIYRTRDLPFGVVLYPLYPRPFERYLPWTNERFARLLGYDHEEMLLLCRTRRGFYSIYDTESRETVLRAFHKSIPYGITSVTFRVNLLGRTRKPIAAVVSMLIRYIQHVPVYTLSFVQPALEPGQCRVIV